LLLQYNLFLEKPGQRTGTFSGTVQTVDLLLCFITVHEAL